MTLATPPLTATAGAKAILIGEHAVLYGHTALAMSLPQIPLTLFWNPPEPVAQGLWVGPSQALWGGLEKGFQVAGLPLDLLAHNTLALTSQIPIAAGLGSSAAFSVALTKLCDALRAHLGLEPLEGSLFLKRANAVDVYFHGKASGVDVATVSSQGLVQFKLGQPPQPVATPPKGCTVVIVDSGQPSATKPMVAMVATQLQDNPPMMGHIRALGALSLDIQSYLPLGDWQAIGALCSQAHGHLKALGLTTARQDHIVEQLLHMGAWGAKMTGGGGGGALLALFDPNLPLPIDTLHALGGVRVAHVGAPVTSIG